MRNQIAILVGLTCIGIAVFAVGLRYAIKSLEDEASSEPIYLNEEAKNHFYPSRELPPLSADHWMSLATDCYLYDGGSFNGMIRYWSCTLPSREKCFEALRDLGDSALSETDMKPWGHSEYRVVMNGPGFYSPSYQTDMWNVNTIQHGVYFEEAQGDRKMSFWAIDLDRNRVYYHYESGGFPDDRYIPK